MNASIKRDETSRPRNEEEFTESELDPNFGANFVSSWSFASVFVVYGDPFRQSLLATTLVVATVSLQPQRTNFWGQQATTPNLANRKNDDDGKTHTHRTPLFS